MVINPMIEELLLKHHPHLNQQSAYPPCKQLVKSQKKEMLEETKALLNTPSSDKKTKLANKLVEGTATHEDLLKLVTYNVSTQFGYNPNVNSSYWNYTPDNYAKMHCFYDFAKVIVPALSRKDYFRYIQYLLGKEMRFPTEAFRNHNITTMFLLIEIELHIATLPATQITSDNIFSNAFLYLLNEVIFPVLNSKTTTMTYERKCQYVKDNLIKKISERLQSLIQQPLQSDFLITKMVSKEPFPQPNLDDPLNQRPIFISDALAEILNTPMLLNPQQQGEEKKGEATNSTAKEMASLPPSSGTPKQLLPQNDRVVRPIAHSAAAPAASSASSASSAEHSPASVSSVPAIPTVLHIISEASPTEIPPRNSTKQTLTQFPAIDDSASSGWSSWLRFFNWTTSPPADPELRISAPVSKQQYLQNNTTERDNIDAVKRLLLPLQKFYAIQLTDDTPVEDDNAEIPWFKKSTKDLSMYSAIQFHTEIIVNFNVLIDLLDNAVIRNSGSFAQLIQIAIQFHKTLEQNPQIINNFNISLSRTIKASLEKMVRALPERTPDIKKINLPALQPCKRPNSAPLENGNGCQNEANVSPQTISGDIVQVNDATEYPDKTQNGLRFTQ